MSSIRIPLTYRCGDYKTEYGAPDSIILCASGVRQHTDVQYGTTKLDIVFTEKGNPNSFRITGGGHLYNDFKQWGGPPALYYVTTQTFARMYRRGYRFFHLEYEK